MTKDDYRLLQNYINHSHNIFVGVHGKVIKQPNKYIQWLGREYGQKIPCCTDLQQVGGTEAGLQCDEPTLRLISHQMSHSQSVHYKHYEKLKGQKKAATALQVRQRLAFGSESEESESPHSQKRRRRASTKPTAVSHKSLAVQDDSTATESEDSEPPRKQKQRVSSDANKLQPKQQRRVYTPAETAAISNYFHNSIVNQQPASVQECRDFLKEHPMRRNTKQVQDKVQQLYMSQ